MPVAGFGFYDTLRYLITGVLLTYILAPAFLHETWATLPTAERLAYGFLIGFIVHSWSLYKLAPKVNALWAAFHSEAAKLSDLSNTYKIWDVTLLVMTTEERAHFRKHFALGATKLDLVVVLFISFVVRGFAYFISQEQHFEVHAALLYAVIGIVLFWIACVLWDDGLNDLRRAMTLSIAVMKRESPPGKGLPRYMQHFNGVELPGHRRFVTASDWWKWMTRRG